jgi:predicted Rossmann fold flavoprotein
VHPITQKIILFDGNSEPGKKILATGNGRCNLSNELADGYAHTKDFFSRLGVLLDSDEEGRVYPMNRSAVAVRDALVLKIKEYGGEIAVGHKVLDIQRGEDGSFRLNTVGKEGKEEEIIARRVVISTGGKTSPAYGNFGDGFTFARGFGHTVNPILPVLTPICYSWMPRESESVSGLAALKGVRAKARVSLYRGDVLLAKDVGEVQFTSDSLSGICIFNLSRYMRRDGNVSNDLSDDIVSIDFLPDMMVDEVELFLHNAGFNEECRRSNCFGLSGTVNPKIAKYLQELLPPVNSGGFAAKAAALLKDLRIPVNGVKGWKNAQVTSGGVDLKEVDPERMESKFVAGVFFAGEVLGYDGPSGGFNLDYAWTTGIKAGIAVAE